jgi:hypothetical protein
MVSRCKTSFLAVRINAFSWLARMYATAMRLSAHAKFNLVKHFMQSSRTSNSLDVPKLKKKHLVLFNYVGTVDFVNKGGECRSGMIFKSGLPAHAVFVTRIRRAVKP